MRLVQALLGALTCALIYWLGRQVARPAVAAAAAVATTLCGPLIFFDGELLPASLATFLNLAGLSLLWQTLHRPSGPGFLGARPSLRIGRPGRAHGPRLRAGSRGLDRVAVARVGRTVGRDLGWALLVGLCPDDRAGIPAQRRHRRRPRPHLL